MRLYKVTEKNKHKYLGRVVCYFDITELVCERNHAVRLKVAKQIRPKVNRPFQELVIIA